MTRSNPLKGGKGDSRSLDEFDPKEVAMGMRVESEHATDKNIVRDIVIDHLTEDPHYYSKLKAAGLAEELKNIFLGIWNDLLLIETTSKKVFSIPMISPLEASSIYNKDKTAKDVVTIRERMDRVRKLLVDAQRAKNEDDPRKERANDRSI